MFTQTETVTLSEVRETKNAKIWGCPQFGAWWHTLPLRDCSLKFASDRSGTVSAALTAAAVRLPLQQQLLHCSTASRPRLDVVSSSSSNCFDVVDRLTSSLTVIPSADSYSLFHLSTRCQLHTAAAAVTVAAFLSHSPTSTVSIDSHIDIQ